MSLDESKIPVECQVKYTQKMYYGKYVYKLTLELDRSKLVKSNTLSWRNIRQHHYSNRFQLINDLLEKIKPNITDDNYRIRSEGVRIGFFTNNVDDVNFIISNFTKNVTELQRPLNENHVEIMDKFKKVVVRSSLFNKNYKFKIYLRYGFDLRETRYKDVKEFLGNLDSDWEVNHTLDRFFNTVYDGRRLGYTVAVYLNNTEDLMMFQLRFNNDITRIEEAVLISDL